jgi:hypothetical protein
LSMDANRLFAMSLMGRKGNTSWPRWTPTCRRPRR